MNRSLRSGLAGAALLVLGLAAAAEAAPRVLQPMVWGWEQIFTVEWSAGDRGGRPQVQGYLVNTSPYGVARLRLLIESLDERGEILAQRLLWLPGELSPFTRVYFESPAPQRAPGYRVRVFDFDQILLGARAQAP